MATLTTTCPHCGKTLSSPEKLGWHLSRECPALVSLTKAMATGEHPPVEPDKR